MKVVDEDFYLDVENLGTKEKRAGPVSLTTGDQGTF